MNLLPSFRQATRSDLIHLVTLLADDPLGEKRENAHEPLLNSYTDAFETIQQDPLCRNMGD